MFDWMFLYIGEMMFSENDKLEMFTILLIVVKIIVKHDLLNHIKLYVYSSTQKLNKTL